MRPECRERRRHSAVGRQLSAASRKRAHSRAQRTATRPACPRPGVAVAGSTVVVSFLDALIVGVDAEREFPEWTKEACEVSGFSKTEPVDRHFEEEFIAGAFSEAVQKLQDRALDREEDRTTTNSGFRSGTVATSTSR